MIYIVIGVGVLILDILTKLMVEQYLCPVGSVELIPSVFHLTYVENPGMAFGMFGGARTVFVIVTILVLGALAFFYSRTKNRTRFLKVGTALIYGGAVGNLLERLAKGYVVDFLDFHLIHFPVFNIADIAVCVGAALLIIHFLVEDKKDTVKGGEEK